MSDFQDQVTVHLKYSRPAMLDSGSEAAHDCTIVIATTLENTKYFYVLIKKIVFNSLRVEDL